MTKKTLILLTILTGVLIFAVLGISSSQKTPKIKVNNVSKPAITTKEIPRLEIIAQNLEVPWALAFLPARNASASVAGGPDKSILFTERPGRVRIIDNNNNLNPTPVAVLSDVLNEGEGGLLGIAIHPNFLTNRFVYLYYTYANNNGQTLNRVARFKFENNSLSDKTIIVDKIPGALFHNGGRIKFGPDGFLYITTGDSQNPSLAQDKNSLAGKILRVDRDGKPAPDNPFGNEIFSYGHRNPQGIAWDKNNRLWATEHGQSAQDEVNIIEKGKNYGWPARLASQPASQAERGGQGESVAGRPTIQENQNQLEMVDPIINSGSDTWAPSGTAYSNNSLFFTGLRGQALYEVEIDGSNTAVKEHFKEELGRVREVTVGPDNLLYITTSNRDGRGFPDDKDDKIIRVNPAKL